MLIKLATLITKICPFNQVDWDRAKLMTHFFRRHKSITMRNYYEAYVQRVSVDVDHQFKDPLFTCCKV